MRRRTHLSRPGEGGVLQHVLLGAQEGRRDPHHLEPEVIQSFPPETRVQIGVPPVYLSCDAGQRLGGVG